MKKYFILAGFLLGNGLIFAQELTLSECITRATTSNTAVALAEQAMFTRENLLKSTRKNSLPKVDLLAGYTYLGKPMEVNLQQVKEGVVEGTAQQNAEAAGKIYEHITGNPLNSQVKDQIYKTSKDILSALYPQNNLPLSKQDYFMAGIFVRQPIYLGGKLNALQELSQQQLTSSKVHLENTKNLLTYNVALQYLQVLYLNAMLEKQEQQVKALEKNQHYAEDLLKAEIIPPYQKQWADVALSQGETLLSNLLLEKDNALLTLKKMMGLKPTDEISIKAKIPDIPAEISNLLAPHLQENTDIRLLQSKKEEAGLALKVAKSSRLPNVFAVGNVQFFRENLPVITPPWMVGVALEWTLFDGFKTKNKIETAESLVQETELLIQQKQEAVSLALNIAQNKIRALRKQAKTLDEARQKTYTTTEMVRKRMENGLSSVKDVNDALKFQYQAEKLYYTSLVAYQTAVATYYYLNGQPEKITTLIK